MFTNDKNIILPTVWLKSYIAHRVYFCFSGTMKTIKIEPKRINLELSVIHQETSRRVGLFAVCVAIAIFSYYLTQISPEHLVTYNSITYIAKYSSGSIHFIAVSGGGGTLKWPKQNSHNINVHNIKVHFIMSSFQKVRLSNISRQ